MVKPTHVSRRVRSKSKRRKENNFSNVVIFHYFEVKLQLQYFEIEECSCNYGSTLHLPFFGQLFKLEFFGLYFYGATKAASKMANIYFLVLFYLGKLVFFPFLLTKAISKKR